MKNEIEMKNEPNNKKLIIITLLIAIFIALGLLYYGIKYDFINIGQNINEKQKNKDENTQETPKETNKETKTQNNEGQSSNEETNTKVNLLSIEDFPLKDDMSETSNYIKFKGLLTAINKTNLDIKKKTLTTTYDKITFKIEAHKTECPGGTGSIGTLEATRTSLKMNDKLVYDNGGIDYPYIIVTDKYIIIRNKNEEILDNEEEIEDEEDEEENDTIDETEAEENEEESIDDNLDDFMNDGNIYIYDKKLNKILEINKINTSFMAKNVEKLNNSLDIAIKDNVIYYVIGNGNYRALKYVNLNEKTLTEKTIKEFEEDTELPRNDTINSVSQFPIDHNLDTPSTINGYKVNIDHEKDIITIKKSKETVKSIKMTTAYVNPNGFSKNNWLLCSGTASCAINNKLYYLKSNKNKTISLVSIDFEKKLKEEILETFKNYNDVELEMHLGQCNRGK